MAYSIIICDDDQNLANELADEVKIALQNMTDDNSNYENLELKIGLIANTFEDVAAYVTANNVKNGIYFLDIELSKNMQAKNGVDLAELIKKEDANAQIIFVTAYDKYAPLTYRRRIGAIDYINKAQPRAKIIGRLEETLQNAVENLVAAAKVNDQIFIYKVGHRVQKVRQNEIYYIENSSTQHKVRMVTETGESEFKGNISRLDDENSFLVKVSQSYLINPNNISAVDMSKRQIAFPNGDEIYFSRDKKALLDKIIADN